MQQLLIDTINGLIRAAKCFEADRIQIGDHIVEVPLPRPRIFRLSASVTWPDVSKGQVLWTGAVRRRESGRISRTFWLGASRQFFYEDMRTPARMLHLIRQLQVATAWCQARQEGRVRHAQEILRQQARAVEALNAEAAMNGLR